MTILSGKLTSIDAGKIQNAKIDASRIAWHPDGYWYLKVPKAVLTEAKK